MRSLTHHSSAEQLNTRATVHDPLQRLQSINLGFDLSIAPGFKDGVPNRVDILAQFSYETSHGVKPAMSRVVQPYVHLADVATSKQASERLRTWMATATSVF